MPAAVVWVLEWQATYKQHEVNVYVVSIPLANQTHCDNIAVMNQERLCNVSQFFHAGNLRGA